jgi:peptide/nickel transport system substrate-binding protein
MARAGITLELTPVAASDYYSKFMTNPVNTKDGTWDIAPVGWTADWAGGSARSVFQPQFTFDGTHQTYNYTDYNNPKANELGAAGDQRHDPRGGRQALGTGGRAGDGRCTGDSAHRQQDRALSRRSGAELPALCAGRARDWTNVWLKR